MNGFRLDEQVLDLFDRLRIPDEKVRNWFQEVLHARRAADEQLTRDHVAERSRQLTNLRNQQDRLLNLRLQEEIDQQTFAAKNTDLRDRIQQLEEEQRQESTRRGSAGRLAEKAFELSQTLLEKWLRANAGVRRQLLQIVCLNCALDGVTLVPTMRKPFDLLAEGHGLVILQQTQGCPAEDTEIRISIPSRSRDCTGFRHQPFAQTASP